jgi:hypothetical protein
MNSKANKGWLNHNYSQIIVIIFSLLIPVIEKTKLNVDFSQWDISIVSILGFIVAALTSLNRQFGFEEKWRHYRLNAETMRNEGDDYFALTGKYENCITHKVAFKTFISTVTSFKRQEVTTYIEEEKKEKKAE